MDLDKILAEIDGEIMRLQQVRSALAGIGEVSTGKRRGRPKGSTNAIKPAKRKRKLTPEGRKRIAEAMKRRWAERRKELGKK